MGDCFKDVLFKDKSFCHLSLKLFLSLVANLFLFGEAQDCFSFFFYLNFLGDYSYFNIYFSMEAFA